MKTFIKISAVFSLILPPHVFANNGAQILNPADQKRVECINRFIGYQKKLTDFLDGKAGQKLWEEYNRQKDIFIAIRQELNKPENEKVRSILSQERTSSKLSSDEYRQVNPFILKMDMQYSEIHCKQAIKQKPSKKSGFFWSYTPACKDEPAFTRHFGIDLLSRPKVFSFGLSSQVKQTEVNVSLETNLNLNTQNTVQTGAKQERSLSAPILATIDFGLQDKKLQINPEILAPEKEEERKKWTYHSLLAKMDSDLNCHDVVTIKDLEEKQTPKIADTSSAKRVIAPHAPSATSSSDHQSAKNAKPR